MNTQQALIDFIQDQLMHTPSEVLEVACGNGPCAIELARKGHLVTAIDQDCEMLLNLREKADLMNVQLATLCCKMDEIKKHIEGHFDFVFCTGNAMMHLDTKERTGAFLNQVKQVLKKEGKLMLQVVSEPCEEVPIEMLKNVGLKLEASYGGYDKSAYDPQKSQYWIGICSV